MMEHQDVENRAHAEQIATESRRKFLKKAGAFAIYTPPAISMLMHPSHASVTKSAGGSYQNASNYKIHDHTGWLSELRKIFMRPE